MNEHSANDWEAQQINQIAKELGIACDPSSFSDVKRVLFDLADRSKVTPGNHRVKKLKVLSGWPKGSKIQTSHSMLKLCRQAALYHYVDKKNITNSYKTVAKENGSSWKVLQKWYVEGSDEWPSEFYKELWLFNRKVIKEMADSGRTREDIISLLSF